MSQRVITMIDAPITPEWVRVFEALALPAIGFLAISAVALWAIKTSARE